MSLFNFLGGGSPATKSNSPEEHAKKTETDSPSLFGGMQLSQDSGHDTASVVPESSGFSFLASSNSKSDLPTAAGVESSSFSFLMQSNNNSEDSHHAKDQKLDIKLSKVASTKTVKKKKRAARVGFARDGEDFDENDDDTQSVQEHSPVSTSSHGTFHEHVHVSSVEIKSSTPPPPPQSMPPPVPEEIIEVIEKSRSNTPIRIANLEESPLPVNSRPTRDDGQTKAAIVKTDIENVRSSPTQFLKVVEKPNHAPIVSINPAIIAVEVPAVKESQFIHSGFESLFQPVMTAIEGNLKILGKLSDTFVSISKRQSSITAEIHNNLLIINRNESNMVEISSKISELESELGKVVALEDFESADNLNRQIDMLKNRVLSHQNEITSLKSTLMNLEQQREANRKLQWTEVHNVMLTLPEKLEEEDGSFDKLSSEVQSSHSSERERLEKEDERIEIERKHIDKEEAALNEESSMIENTISTQCGDVSESKSLIEMELATVTREIDELEKMLSLKRAEEKNLKSSLIGLDTKIQDIRKKYDRQLHRIQERRDLLTKTVYEWSHEKTSISTMIKAFGDKSMRIEKSIEDMKESSISSKKDFELLVTLNEVIESLNDISSTANDDSQAHQTSAYSNLVDRVTKAEVELSNIKKSIDEGKAQIEQWDIESISIMDDIIPKLENEKKSHATAKRFKEAATAAKDIKTYLTKKEDMDAMKNYLLAEIVIMENDLKSAIDGHTSAMSALRQAQLIVDESKFAVVMRILTLLRKARRKIYSETNGYRSIIGASCVGYLDTEIGVLNSEAQEINSRHNLVPQESEYGCEDINSELNDSVETEPDNIGIVGGTTISNYTEDVATESEHVDQTEVAAEVIAEVTLQVALGESLLESDLEEMQRGYEAAIADLSEQLKVATDEENYELAAQLFESLEEQTAMLDQIKEKVRSKKV